MRGRSRNRRAHGSTGGPAIDTYGEQPGNSSSGSEQRHAIHKVDGPVEKAIRSQSIRTQKGDNTTQIAKLTEAIASIDGRSEKPQDSSQSQREQAAGPPPISPTHLALPHLPSAMHISYEYVTTDNKDNGNERNPEDRQVHRVIRNYTTLLNQSDNTRQGDLSEPN